MLEIAKYLIRKYEGLSLTAYKCPAGLLTIGYGHVLKKEMNVSEIDLDSAEKLLEQDCLIALRSVEKLIKTNLSENQLASLISFTFNLGGAALERSSLRQKLNRGDYLEAADEFLRWVYASGRKLPGLIRRRTEERAIFLLNH
jgi:lysozyme